LAGFSADLCKPKEARALVLSGKHLDFTFEVVRIVDTEASVILSGDKLGPADIAGVRGLRVRGVKVEAGTARKPFKVHIAEIA
jgi:hypothetical protein